MSTADILRAAKARIDTPEKWYHGKGDGECVDYCPQTAITAVVRAVSPSSFADEEVLALYAEAIGVSGVPYKAIWLWNDAPERTHADVLAAFDKAVALAELEAEAAR